MSSELVPHIYKYKDYISHIKNDCLRNKVKECPKGCGKSLNRYTLEDHFVYHYCEKLKGICSLCYHEVKIESLKSHGCYQ
mmetsp:Transcript_17565/g.29649  ORF Transcript_17565/g.29649 Transcript_17565/m.29649 type:complete len:80 (-) Transcript_17565:239-478(-)